MVQLKKVSQDEVYETIHSYVENSENAVETYEDMINMILSMIKDGYCFVMERDYLRDAMESLTYMYSPEDDMNKDRIILQFADDEEDEEDEEDDVDMLKMMQMMGMAPPMKAKEETDESDEPVAEDSTKSEEPEPVEATKSEEPEPETENDP